MEDKNVNKKICEICNEIFYGKCKYCSSECRKIGRMKNIKKTNLERYGVENISQNKQTKEKIQQTCLERYGKKSYTQTTDFKNKRGETCFKKYGNVIHQRTQNYLIKYKETCIQKYGSSCFLKSETYKNTMCKKYNVKNIFQIESIKNKIRKTINERYGKNCFTQTEKYKKTVRKIFRKKYKDTLFYKLKIKNLKLLSSLDDYLTKDFYELQCKDCEKIFKSNGNLTCECKKYYSQNEKEISN